MTVKVTLVVSTMIVTMVSSLLLVVSSFQFPMPMPIPRIPMPMHQQLSSTSTSTRSTSTSTSSQLFMAGFGSPVSSKKNIKKGGGGIGGKNNNNKETKTKINTTELKNRLLKKVNKMYGGTTPEQITIGTEKRIELMMTSKIKQAFVLRDVCQQFDKRVSGMDFNTIRKKFTNNEIEIAVKNRDIYELYLQNNNLSTNKLQIEMQRITWNASATAKACKSLTGNMSITYQNRVLKASQYAYDVCCNSQNDKNDNSDNSDNDNSDNNNNLVLDVGCGYGVTIPFLKKVGFKNKQIHGIDLSNEMIDYAKQFYPDIVYDGGKFIANDFYKLGDNDNDDDKEDATTITTSKNKNKNKNNTIKYRSVLFCSALHDLPDMKSALLKTKNELLDTTKKGSRIIIIHAQGASHVQGQNKQNSLLVPRTLPTTAELNDWLCNDTNTNTNNDNDNTNDGNDSSTIKMKLIVEPAESKSEREIREGYLAVLEII